MLICAHIALSKRVCDRRHRNLDNTPVVTDSVYFVRNPKCNNYKAGTPLPTPAPPATLAPSPTVNNKLSAVQVGHSPCC